MTITLGTKTCPQIAAHRDGATYMAAFYNEETGKFIITAANPEVNLDVQTEYHAEQAYEEWEWMTGTALFDRAH